MKKRKSYKQSEKKKHYLQILIKIKNDFTLLIRNYTSQKIKWNSIIKMSTAKIVNLFN